MTALGGLPPDEREWLARQQAEEDAPGEDERRQRADRRRMVDEARGFVATLLFRRLRETNRIDMHRVQGTGMSFGETMAAQAAVHSLLDDLERMAATTEIADEH